MLNSDLIIKELSMKSDSKELKIGINEWKIIFLMVFLNFAGIIPGLNYLMLFVQIFLFYYFYNKKKYIYFGLLLFNFSTYGLGISIYSFKIIYLLILSLLIFDKKKLLMHINDKSKLYFFLSFLALFIAYSSYNLMYSFKHYITDVIIIFGILCGYILFKDLKKQELLKLSLLILFVELVTRFVIIFTGFGLSNEIDMFGNRTALIGDSEGSSIFIFICIYLLFFLKRHYWEKILILLIYIYTSIKLSAFGSMIMMFFVLCFIFILFEKYLFASIQKRFFSLVLVPLLLIGIIMTVSFISNVNSMNSQEDNRFLYKVQNISKLLKYLDFTDEEKIFMIPLSPRVRVLEIANTLKTGNPASNIFGRGIGGHFKDDFIQFENHAKFRFLGDADFSKVERESHTFFTAHNWGYPLLKYGVLFFILVFLYSYLKMKKYKKKKDSFRLYFYFILFLSTISYFGFTFQTSLIIGLLWAIALDKQVFFEKRINIVNRTGELNEIYRSVD